LPPAPAAVTATAQAPLIASQPYLPHPGSRPAGLAQISLICACETVAGSRWAGSGTPRPVIRARRPPASRSATSCWQDRWCPRSGAAGPAGRRWSRRSARVGLPAG